jgi:N-carbamoylputrescine amidase
VKVTVCELPNHPAAFEDVWQALCQHTRELKSEFVLLPEMPFYPWLAYTPNVRPGSWVASVEAHREWVNRLADLAPATVASSRAAIEQGIRRNVGFVWEPERGQTGVHTKYYLPDEPGFWEATWYSRGKREFDPFQIIGAKLGFLICTELWFARHARDYGKQGVQLLVCPRATISSSVEKWVVGGQAAAVVSGAFCLSSNRTGTSPDGGEFAGTGWIIEPEEGRVLGLTSPEQPFLTVDLDLSLADRAKSTYPRYIPD